MKSRISYFDATVFKKNLTRFAPCWGLYTVWLTMTVLLGCSSAEEAGTDLLRQAQSHSAFLFFFAPLLTQLLFGDLLYNPRMCNALHALPPRRETWFFTNVASGFTIFLIPAVTTAVLAALIFRLVGYPGNMAVVPLWLLQMLLKFTCFFGISVFSAFFAGNRFAHTVMYGLINFGALILSGLLSNLYTPMFYGVRVNTVAFERFCPAGRLGTENFLTVEQQAISTSNYYPDYVDTKVLLRGENFGYCFIAAAVGLALIWAGLWLYRRRKLECAGDFIAVAGIKPVFSLVYTLTVASFFHVISAGILLLPGLVIGWFTSLMLLERTGRVFKKKNFLRGGALTGIFLLTLAVAAWDPLGIEAWVPEAEKVESVSIYEGHYSYEGKEKLLLLEEQEDVETVIGIHRDCLERWVNHTDSYYRIGNDIVFTAGNEDSIPLTISYQLKNGRTVNRYYDVPFQENAEHLTRWLSTPEQIFGADLTEEEFLEQNQYVTIRIVHSTERITVLDPEARRELYQAILADCEEGNMASFVNRHSDKVHIYTLEFENGETLAVYTDCVHTLQWIENHK